MRVIARLNTGGPARHVVWLAADLPQNQFETTLVCGSVPPGESNMSYFAAQHNVVPVIIPEMSRELSPKDVVSLWKLYRLIKKERPDIIHTHTAKAGTLGRVAGFLYRWLTFKTFAGRPRRVAFVHTYHGHVFHSYYGRAKTEVFLLIERMLAKFATDRILVLSEQQRREINEDFRVGRPKQFQIVPLGIDLSQFQNWQARRHILRDELCAKEDEILIGIVGRLTEVKNHNLFLRVAQMWKEQIDSELPRVRFLIIGDGHLRSALEREAAELRLTAETLVFLGERRDPEILYPAFDIVALTSLNEGTPLTLIEAMANARAVISTAVGGTVDLLGAANRSPNLVQIAERGLLVPSENAEEFAAGLKILVQNETLRAELGARGAVFVAENYSKERLIEDIANLYRELLAN